MWFWWFMFFCDLLTPALLIFAGRAMWKHCPKEINGLLGYRTKRSMKNMDTWKFAHRYCGRLWWKLGWLLLFPTVLVQIPLVHGSEDRIGMVGGILCGVQCVSLISSVFLTERALKKTFHEDGSRR